MTDREEEKRRIATGDKIRRWREAKGLSQEQLAGLAGLTGRTIHLLENGATDTKAGNICRIAEVLHTSPSALIDGEDKRKDDEWQELEKQWQRMAPSSKEVIYVTMKAMMDKMEQITHRRGA